MVSDDEDNPTPVGYHWHNFVSYSSVSKLLYMLVAIAGVVSAAIARLPVDGDDLFVGYNKLRISYLAFISAGFIVQLAFLLFDLRYVPYGSPFTRNIVMIVIKLIIYVLIFVGIFVCSIWAYSMSLGLATDSITINGAVYFARTYYRNDAYYVCAIVGYMMSLLFFQDVLYMLLRLLQRITKKSSGGGAKAGTNKSNNDEMRDPQFETTSIN